MGHKRRPLSSSVRLAHLNNAAGGSTIILWLSTDDDFRILSDDAMRLIPKPGYSNVKRRPLRDLFRNIIAIIPGHKRAFFVNRIPVILRGRSQMNDATIDIQL
jgi:hypothetical protein